MKIGKLVAEAGVNIDTIRFYERKGVLPEPERRPSGYRNYGPETVQRLHFIRNAKRLGFSLTEITELLELSSGDDMGAVRAAASEKLASVREKIADLERMREALDQVITACPGHGATSECPIVRSLSSPVRIPETSAS